MDLLSVHGIGKKGKENIAIMQTEARGREEGREKGTE